MKKFFILGLLFAGLFVSCKNKEAAVEEAPVEAPVEEAPAQEAPAEAPADTTSTQTAPEQH